MSERTMSPKLTGQFSKALVYAEAKHHRQTRKGGDIPYIGHLLSVAGLVIEGGGDETQAIAALLHDTVEDAGGQPTLDEIRANFGDDVADIVRECSDTDKIPKPPWRQRKEDYIAHLDEASDETIVVSLADKLDNARAILRDFRIEGSALWQRFSVHDPADHIWYYGELLDVYKRRSTTWLVEELQRTLNELKHLVAEEIYPLTRPITASDIAKGIIRFRDAAKASLPEAVGEVPVNLLGIPIQARWNPRVDDEFGRSGYLSLGSKTLKDLIVKDEVLEVVRCSDGLIVLRRR
jgi:hypothetical protein